MLGEDLLSQNLVKHCILDLVSSFSIILIINDVGSLVAVCTDVVANVGLGKLKHPSNLEASGAL